MKLWMYESWLKDYEEKHQFARDYTIFSGSFHNPEAAKQLMQEEDPDVALTDEEELASMKRVLDEGNVEGQAFREVKSPHRRRRRLARKVINKMINKE